MLTKPGEWGNVKIDPCPDSVNSETNQCFSTDPLVQSGHARQGSTLNLLIGLALVAMVVGIVLWWRARPQIDSSLAEPGAGPRASLMQIVLHEDACPAAQQLQNARFDKSSVPILPLSACNNPESCHCRCRYVPVDDRRSGDRRGGEDKRESRRIELDPRRKDRDRRMNEDIRKQGPV